ncbi:MAG: hypothetical protein ACREJU_14130 [Nitrospiraceae bacterium]
MALTCTAIGWSLTHDANGSQPVRLSSSTDSMDGGTWISERTVSRWVMLQELQDRMMYSGSVIFLTLRQSG